jgi:uncharacterized protein
MSALVTHLARFAGALRETGVRVSLSDEIDAAQALSVVDVTDVDEVRRALLVALKIQPRDRAAFDRLFASAWLGRTTPPHRGRQTVRQRSTAVPRGLLWRTAEALPEEALGDRTEGGTPGYSPRAQLRHRPFDALTPAEITAMERLLERLTLRLATEESRRYVPTRGHGVIDLRRTLRRTLATGGEPLALARRERAAELPRLVLLCDTSGSMESHTRFLLCFAIALRRVVRRLEVFAFNTALTRLTPWLAPGKINLTLKRLAEGVPDWSGGTRIGTCLEDFVARYQTACVNSRTTVVILSDGLDRGDVATLVRAMRAIHARARRVIWLNPLLGDPRYEPSARGMQAALPYIDRLAPAHNLESLERLVTYLAA